MPTRSRPITPSNQKQKSGSQMKVYNTSKSHAIHQTTSKVWSTVMTQTTLWLKRLLKKWSWMKCEIRNQTVEFLAAGKPRKTILTQRTSLIAPGSQHRRPLFLCPQHPTVGNVGEKYQHDNVKEVRPRDGQTLLYGQVFPKGWRVVHEDMSHASGVRMLSRWWSS